MKLEFNNVSFRYNGLGGSDTVILDDISFHVDQNECLALAGPSGSGKTTLIQHITGLLKPAKGTITANGFDINRKDYDIADLRKKIGLVFQFPENQLFEETVEKDIAFGPLNMGFVNYDLEIRIKNALETVELDMETMAKRSPFHLSEGEKRRVAIAGVLAMEPDLIVFDEPTAGLDPKSVKKIISIIKRLIQMKKSVIVVSHHMDFISKVAHRIMVLVKGRIVYLGKPSELFFNTQLLDKVGLEEPGFYKALRDFSSSIPELKLAKNLEDFRTKIKEYKEKLQN